MFLQVAKILIFKKSQTSGNLDLKSPKRNIEVLAGITD